MEAHAALMKNTDQQTATIDNFQDLFKTYYSFVVRQIMRIVKEPTIAEDLAQDVFLQFYHTDRTSIENIQAWLAKASLYAAYNFLRSEKRRQTRTEIEIAEQPVISPSSEEKWLEKEEIAAVREVLLEMDERDRTLLMMKYSGFPYNELALAVGVEKTSIGTLLSRAKTKFRTMYKQMRGEES